MAPSNIESKVQSWLTVVFEKKNFKDLSVKVLGNLEKGDGLSYIVFVQTSGTHTDGSVEKYDLALKCNNNISGISAQNIRFKESFVNEIFVYDEVLPALIQFQKAKEIEDVFDKVPKCYGTLTEEDALIIVLENLKTKGYELWPKKEPLTRKHIDLVIEQYAKFHAASSAMEIQQPDKFRQITNTLQSNLKNLLGATNNISLVFKSCIEYVAEVLKDDLDENTLLKWKYLGGTVKSIFDNVRNHQGFKTLIHGDCWNNNFMFKYENGDQEPSEVVIIDWQETRQSLPVCDLSYFLFVCLSTENIEDLDDILNFYYNSFSSHLQKLGINDPNAVYSFCQLMEDWDRYSIRGIILASLLLKVCLAEKDDIGTKAENTEQGGIFSSSLVKEIKNTTAFKNRMKHIVEYANNKGYL